MNKVTILTLSALMLTACGQLKQASEPLLTGAVESTLPQRDDAQHWGLKPHASYFSTIKAQSSPVSRVGVSLSGGMTLDELAQISSASGVKVRAVYYKSPVAQGVASFPISLSGQDMANRLREFLGNQSQNTLSNLATDLSMITGTSEDLDIRNVGQTKKYMEQSPKNRNAIIELVGRIDDFRDANTSRSGAIIYGLQVQGSNPQLQDFVSKSPVLGIEDNSLMLDSGALPMIPSQFTQASKDYLARRDEYSKMSNLEIAKLISKFEKGQVLKLRPGQQKNMGAQAISGNGDPFPKRGTVYYTPNNRGTYKDDIRFTLAWDTPGGWWIGPARGDNKTHPGIFEMDFVDTGYLSVWDKGCISRSDLPEPYDDCPTSGVSEGGGLSHGFGSWNASAIVPSRIYNAVVELQRNSTMNTSFKVTWGTLQHNLCSGNPNPSVGEWYVGQPEKYYTCAVNWPYMTTEPAGGQVCTFFSTERNIWCVIGARGGVLVDNSYITFGQKYTETWTGRY